MSNMRNIFIAVVVLAVFVGAGLLYIMKYPPVAPKAVVETAPAAVSVAAPAEPPPAPESAAQDAAAPAAASVPAGQ